MVRGLPAPAYTCVMLPPASPHTENIVIILLAIATGVAVISRWARLPYTVALVIAGLALGALHVVAVPHLTRELVFSVFLPGLVFEAAFHLRYSEIRRDGGAILGLAVPGVGVALALTAAVLVMAGKVLRSAGLIDASGAAQPLAPPPTGSGGALR